MNRRYVSERLFNYEKDVGSEGDNYFWLYSSNVIYSSLGD